jgi:hypothetical protein
VDGHDELDAVGQHDRHAVTCLHPAACQVAGEGVGQAVQVGEGPPLVAGQDGVPVRRALRRSLECLVHRSPRHGNHVL